MVKMKLTDLKLSKEKVKKRHKNMVSDAPPGDSYPWGLNITLNKDSLSKLGLDLKKFQIGKKVMIMAECAITEIRQSKDMYDESEALGLQIQKLSFKKGKSSFGKYNDKMNEGPG